MAKLWHLSFKAFLKYSKLAIKGVLNDKNETKKCQ